MRAINILNLFIYFAHITEHLGHDSHLMKAISATVPHQFIVSRNENETFHQFIHARPGYLHVYYVNPSPVILCILDILRYWREPHVAFLYSPKFQSQVQLLNRQKYLKIHPIMWQTSYYTTDFQEMVNVSQGTIVVCCEAIATQTFLNMVFMNGTFSSKRNILVVSHLMPTIFQLKYKITSQISLLKPVQDKPSPSHENDSQRPVKFELYDVVVKSNSPVTNFQIKPAVAFTNITSIKMLEWDLFKGLSIVDAFQLASQTNLSSEEGLGRCVTCTVAHGPFLVKYYTVDEVCVPVVKTDLVVPFCTEPNGPKRTCCTNVHPSCLVEFNPVMRINSLNYSASEGFGMDLLYILQGMLNFRGQKLFILWNPKFHGDPRVPKNPSLRSLPFGDGEGNLEVPLYFDCDLYYYSVNFTFTDDKLTGTQLENGSFTGTSKLLDEKDVHIVLMPTQMTSSRWKFLRVHFPVLVIHSGLWFKQDNKEDTFSSSSHISAFSPNVWLISSVIFTIVVLLLAVALKSSPYAEQAPETKFQSSRTSEKFKHYIQWFISGEFFEDAMSDSSGASTKLILGTLNLSVTLVYLYYTSIFSSVLTTQQIPMPFNNLEELVSHPDYRVLALNKSGNLELLRIAQSGLLKGLYNKIEKPDGLMNNASEAMHRICEKEKFALFYDVEAASIVANSFQNCSLKYIDMNLLTEFVYLGIRNDLLLETTFTSALIRIYESGILQRLKKTYFSVINSEVKAKSSKKLSHSTFAFGLNHIVVPLGVLINGIVSSLLILSFELIIYRISSNMQKKRENNNFIHH